MYDMDDGYITDNEEDDGHDSCDDAGAPAHHLEPNHTHFILVGNLDSTLGDEVAMRDELVHTIARCKIKGSNGREPVCIACLSPI